jgi:hypothetical protein
VAISSFIRLADFGMFAACSRFDYRDTDLQGLRTPLTIDDSNWTQPQGVLTPFGEKSGDGSKMPSIFFLAWADFELGHYQHLPMIDVDVAIC